MKNIILILFLCSLGHVFSQTVNDYSAVIIPLRYNFQSADNQYRLQTLTKINLEKAGFKAFYANEEIPTAMNNRCSFLYVDVKKENAFLVTKLYLSFKDCYGTEIYKSNIGKSREKEYVVAYKEALDDAFVSVYDLKYTYKENKNVETITTTAVAKVPISVETNVITKIETPDRVVIPSPVPEIVPIIDPSKPRNQLTNIGLLYAQQTTFGFQLIDSQPKVVMKLYKTSLSTSYIAKYDSIQGVLVSKGNQWFLEYYQNEVFVSEKIEVKF
jgi:hypothetical protein